MEIGNLDTINKKYKYSKPMNGKEYLEAEKYILAKNEERVYYSATSEKRRIVIHRKSIKLDKKVKDDLAFFNQLVQEYLSNINAENKIEDIEDLVFVNSKSQGVRKVTKVEDEDVIDYTFSYIEFDAIFSAKFQLFKSKRKLKIIFKITSLMTLEFLALKSLNYRRQYKKYFKSIVKKIKKIRNEYIF